MAFCWTKSHKRHCNMPQTVMGSSQAAQHGSFYLSVHSRIVVSCAKISMHSDNTCRRKNYFLFTRYFLSVGRQYTFKNSNTVDNRKQKGTNRQDRLWLAPFPKSLLPPQSVESLPPCRFSILINNRPMAVQTSSRTRTISATKMPAPAERASPAVDMIKPPSRPPSCNGRKNNRLANRLVNASINIHCVNVTSIPGRTKRMNIISSAEQTRQASSSSTAETNVLGFWLCKAAIWRSIVSSCSLCLSIKPRAQRFSPGMWRTKFISLTAMPLRYPLRKNHTPRAQKAPAEARIKSMAKLSRSVIRYIKMESSQKIKWLKICVIAYRITDDEARSVPIFGDNAIIR